MDDSKMKNSKEFYEKTKNNIVNKELRYFINSVEHKTGKAIELGCGAGVNTAYLIKNKWEVMANDIEDVEGYIKEKLTKEELKKLSFVKGRFEEIELEENDLTFACNSLSFCEQKNFQKLWTRIEQNINVNGFFVGNFFGVKDAWYKTPKGEKMTFLTREQVFDLFKNFEIIEFCEKNNVLPSASGNMKHWHIFWVIAKKLK